MQVLGHNGPKWASAWAPAMLVAATLMAVGCGGGSDGQSSSASTAAPAAGGDTDSPATPDGTASSPTSPGDASNPDAAVTVSPMTQKLTVLSAAELGGLEPVDLNDKNQILGGIKSSRLPVRGYREVGVWSAGRVSVDVVGQDMVANPAGPAFIRCVFEPSELNAQGDYLITRYCDERADDQATYSVGGKIMRAGKVLFSEDARGLRGLTDNGRVMSGSGFFLYEEGRYQAFSAAGLAYVLNGAWNNDGIGLQVVGGDDFEYPEAVNVFTGESKSLWPHGMSGSVAWAINNAGDVVGANSNVPMMWNWSTGVSQELVCPDQLGRASGVGPFHIAHGHCGGTVSGGSAPVTVPDRGVLWQGDQRVDVNTLLDAESQSKGWVIANVGVLNQQGWMLAWATDGTGVEQAVILKPTNTP